MSELRFTAYPSTSFQLNDATCARLLTLLERIAETRRFWHDNELRDGDRGAPRNDTGAPDNENGAPQSEDGARDNGNEGDSETYRKNTVTIEGANGGQHDDTESPDVLGVQRNEDEQ